MNMNEPPGGGCLVRCAGKQSNLENQRACADFFDFEPGGHCLWKRDFGEVIAPGFHHQKDRFAIGGIKKTIGHVPAVDGRIEEAQVDDVIHMSVDIHIHPTRWNCVKIQKIGAR